MTRALVLLADGCEEMEAVIIIDTLRRASWDVVAAGVTGELITASRGVVLKADKLLADVDPSTCDLLVLPGGGAGTNVLRGDSRVLSLVRTFHTQGKIVAAICAGPLVLQEAGILDHRRATCHPGVREEFSGEASSERVVVDGTVVTSQGPGTSFEFALRLIQIVDGEKAAQTVAKELILP